MAALTNRAVLVRRAILLESAIIAYNLAEGLLSIIAGRLAGSIVPVGLASTARSR